MGLRMTKVKTYAPFLLMAMLFHTTWPDRISPRQEQSLLDRAVKHEEIVGHLWNTLPLIGQIYGVPVVAELSSDRPCQLHIGRGKTTLLGILRNLKQQCGNYGWKIHGRVVHVHEISLMGATGNFLNWKIESISLPKNVAELELQLRSVLDKKRAGITQPGGVVVGIYSSALAQLPLPEKKFADTTCREILLAAANLNPGFMTVVEFPNSTPNTRADFDAAFLRWRWIALDAQQKDLT